MGTVIETIRSIPEPYRQEVLDNRNKHFDNADCGCDIQNMLMQIMPPSIIRDTIIKAYLRGDLNPKAEARPETPMPELSLELDTVRVYDGSFSAKYKEFDHKYPHRYTTSDLFDQEYDR